MRERIFMHARVKMLNRHTQKSHSSNRTHLGAKYKPKNMCNTIHSVPTRAAATKFHPVQYSNFFLLVCLGCSR